MHATEIVQRGIDYIEARLIEPLALEEIAASASMSVPNLYRMFYAKTGHPIKEYIRKRRTSEAAIMLRHTVLPMIEICFACGFDTYQTFVKTFKRNTGLTPSQYRQSGLIYSFERIDLSERTSYMEEREVTERYPGIQVIRRSAARGVGYLHVAESKRGLEAAAIGRFQALLSELGIDIGQFRLFGWNVDFDDSPCPHGYQMVAVGEGEVIAAVHPELREVEVAGGLYAVTRSPFGDERGIVAAWNRLLSEWLPRSTFSLDEGAFTEEYQRFNGQITRMKLYLPVRRGQDQEKLEIVRTLRKRVIVFRAECDDCASVADDAAVDFLKRNRLAGDPRIQMYMSCSFPPEEKSVYELYLQLPDGFILSPKDLQRTICLEGGWYACLTTAAYGLMTGVLERIQRWLGASADYEWDDSRMWYAQYIPDGNGVNVRSTGVRCYVPIILKTSRGGPA